MRKPELTTGTFKSTTGRLVEDDLKLEVKIQKAAVGQYENQIAGIGKGLT